MPLEFYEPKAKEAKEADTSESKAQRRCRRHWYKAHRWHPHRLRHAAATHVREATDSAKAAQVVLRHANLSTTEIYTAKGLPALLEDLLQRKINLISIRDGIDLNTAAGRLMANVLASVGQYETEVRAQRVRAGQQAARRNGAKWGGSKKVGSGRSLLTRLMPWPR